MDRWGVGRAGVNDGVVVLIMLDRSRCHGAAWVHAGKGALDAWFDGDESRIDELYKRVVEPRLADCDIDEALLGVSRSLERRARDTVEATDPPAAPPTPRPQPRTRPADAAPGTVDRIAATGLVVAGLLVALASLAWWWLRGRDPRLSTSSSIHMPAPPGGMSAASGATLRARGPCPEAFAAALIHRAVDGQVRLVADGQTQDGRQAFAMVRPDAPADGAAADPSAPRRLPSPPPVPPSAPEAAFATTVGQLLDATQGRIGAVDLVRLTSARTRLVNGLTTELVARKLLVRPRWSRRAAHPAGGADRRRGHPGRDGRPHRRGPDRRRRGRRARGHPVAAHRGPPTCAVHQGGPPDQDLARRVPPDAHPLARHRHRPGRRLMRRACDLGLRWLETPDRLLAWSVALGLARQAGAARPPSDGCRRWRAPLGDRARQLVQVGGSAASAPRSPGSVAAVTSDRPWVVCGGHRLRPRWGWRQLPARPSPLLADPRGGDGPGTRAAGRARPVARDVTGSRPHHAFGGHALRTPHPALVQAASVPRLSPPSPAARPACPAPTPPREIAAPRPGIGHHRPMSSRARFVLLLALCAGALLVGVELMITAVALPRILADLADWTQLRRASWIVNGYLLAYIAMMPLAGRLGDRFGIPRLFMLALGLFARAAPRLSGMAPTLDWLIGARIVQGLGAGAILPLATAGASHLYDGHTRARALGVVGAATFLGMALGPFLGATVLEVFDLGAALDRPTCCPGFHPLVEARWRWVFYLGAPLSIISLVWVWAVVARLDGRAGPRPTGRHGRRALDRSARDGAHRAHRRWERPQPDGALPIPLIAGVAALVLGCRRHAPRPAHARAVPRPPPVPQPGLLGRHAAQPAHRLRAGHRHRRRRRVRRPRPVRRARRSSASCWASLALAMAVGALGVGLPAPARRHRPAQPGRARAVHGRAS